MEEAKIEVEINGQTFGFRAPTQDEFEEYQSKLGEKHKGPAFRALCQACLCQGSIDALIAGFEAKPAAPVRIADALSDLAGAEIEIKVKKG